ncbi:unnamed protein product [Prunus armeniaca]
MSAIDINFLQYMRLVPGCRNYQLFGGPKHCLCPLLTFLVSIRGLQALGRLGCLNGLCLLLIEQLLCFVHFGRKKVVMFLQLCHILPKGSDLGQKLGIGRSLNY